MDGPFQEHHQLVLVSGRPISSESTVNQISLRADGLATLREMHDRLLQEEELESSFFFSF